MKRARPETCKHKLVALGDSLAQGFKNGGIHRPEISFPALIARCMGPGTHFETPAFREHWGLPINLEKMTRELSNQYGDHIRKRDYPAVILQLYRRLREAKLYWEDEANHRDRERQIPYHNQAIWGAAANDIWLMTERICRSYLHDNPERFSVFSVLPDHAMYITGRLVLNPGFSPGRENNSQIDNLALLHENGGVENLILCTGHNNFVGALSALEVMYSEPGYLERYHHERSHTVYRPEHFREELDNLYRRIASLGIPRVFVPTFPYLTIPPVTRGINLPPIENHTGYFDYYTRFWIWDEDFDPDKHPHLTREEAIELDILADQYNQIVRELASKYEFHAVPVHKYVNAVARRRLGVEAVRPYPPAFIEALRRHPATAHLVTPDNRVKLSTDFLEVDEENRKIKRGGIFSLDGLHPSTIGYGLIANIYRMIMQKQGVEFESEMDWDYVIQQERLVSDPPFLLAELRLLFRFLSMGRRERFTRLGQNILQQLLARVTRH